MRDEDLDVRRNRMLGEAPEGVHPTTAANAEAEDRLEATWRTPSRRTQILGAAAVLIAVDVVLVFVLMSPAPPPVHQSSSSTAVTQLGPSASPGAPSAP